jgi:acyl carrier protein
MEREKIEKKANDVLVDVLGIDYSEIKNDAVLEDDFGADSLDAVEIVMGLEH